MTNIDAHSVEIVTAVTPTDSDSNSDTSACVVLAICKRGATRAMWATLSLTVIIASEALTGMRRLDDMGAAPWIRTGVLFCSLVCLAAVAARVSRISTAIADAKESRHGVLLRKDAIGPPRRWAIWIATAATACIASYLLNEHRPATPTFVDLLPARGLDLVVVACGIVLVAPYVRDLAAGVPTRNLPWSSPARLPRQIREDVDVMGALGRMSPPLLLAIGLALLMLFVTCVVGAYRPSKLLGGFGVLGLYGAGLLAAPTLLRAQGETIERAWITRWYPAQWRFVLILRPAVSQVHKIVLVVQISSLGVALGAIGSGGERVSLVSARLILTALIVAACGFALARMLWIWAVSPSEEGPICTDVLASSELNLTMLAGWALMLGSLCSLAAVFLA